nr:glutathione synthetase [Schizosaccharomyces pombe]
MEIEKYTPEQIEELGKGARDFAFAHGVVFTELSVSKEGRNIATQIPITLFPSVIPHGAFVEAVSVQKAYNKLYAKIANDYEFLRLHLQSITKYDEFMNKLWNLYQKHREAVAHLKENQFQPLSLGVFRSDYTVHQDDSFIGCKQVEFNTISVSFGGVSKAVSNLHAYCSQSGLYRKPLTTNYLTVNTSVSGICTGISNAVDAYRDYVKNITSKMNIASDNTKPIVLFVVKGGERNITDQRTLEYELLNRFHVISKRIDIAELNSLIHDKSSNKLYMKTSFTTYEVAVVYYRVGYALDDYPSQEAWDMRLTIENTLAIKCPSISTHLAGSKKIQQVLAESNALERFLEGDELQAVRSTFADMYPLDDTPRGKEGIKLAFEKPEDFVLKPQREGGGNNTYGKDIPGLLSKMPQEEWDSYILMRYINAVPSQNYILKGERPEKFDVVDEIGILGTIVWNIKTDEVVQNGQSGFICRTKPKKTNEGGVATGYASLSSIELSE